MTTEENQQAIASTEAETPAVETGPVFQWLADNGIGGVKPLGPDHAGVEILAVEVDMLLPIAQALQADGFNCLQCQGGYDLGPGKELVSFYHLIEIADDTTAPREVRLHVFLSRENPSIPSVYWIWRGADWQERETYDMYGIVFEGHPNLKRILMNEDWIGWPLRKDYISPDFYELQHAE